MNFMAEIIPLQQISRYVRFAGGVSAYGTQVLTINQPTRSVRFAGGVSTYGTQVLTINQPMLTGSDGYWFHDFYVLKITIIVIISCSRISNNILRPLVCRKSMRNMRDQFCISGIKIAMLFASRCSIFCN